MWQVIKVLFVLLVICCLGLVLFAYIGPLLGFDFSAHQGTVVKPVSLDGP